MAKYWSICVQEQQDAVQQRVSKHDIQQWQVVADLKGEIERLKSALKSESEARQAVANLLGNVDQIDTDLDVRHPAGFSYRSPSITRAQLLKI